MCSWSVVFRFVGVGLLWCTCLAFFRVNSLEVHVLCGRWLIEFIQSIIVQMLTSMKYMRYVCTIMWRVMWTCMDIKQAYSYMINVKLGLYKIMPVHSDWSLVAKKFDILKPLVAKTCDRSLVAINICVNQSAAINLVGRYRLIATPLTTTYTSVTINL